MLGWMISHIKIISFFKMQMKKIIWSNLYYVNMVKPPSKKKNKWNKKKLIIAHQSKNKTKKLDLIFKISILAYTCIQVG